MGSKAAAKVSGSPVPHDRRERSLHREGFAVAAGIDEVGRGAWAGPVSVGVVVFRSDKRPPKGLRDSKLLSEDRREALYPQVVEWCVEWAVGHAGPLECDELGMTAAQRLAARRALGTLATSPEVVLLDGVFDYLTPPAPPAPPAPPEISAADGGGSGELAPPPLPSSLPSPSSSGPAPFPEVRTVVRGDVTCVSIAAASIVAKVTRDRMMRDLAASFPAFDFDRNKGYPSPTHRTALAGFGLTSVHRRSWSYVDDLAFR